MKDGKSGEVKEKLKGDDDGCKRVKQKKSKGGDDGSEHVKRNKSKRGDDGKKKSKVGDDGSGGKEPVKYNTMYVWDNNYIPLKPCILDNRGGL